MLSVTRSGVPWVRWRKWDIIRTPGTVAQMVVWWYGSNGGANDSDIVPERVLILLFNLCGIDETRPLRFVDKFKP